jgi:methionyl-tRNA formyltransferase
MKKPCIAFMGTPDFAVPSLEILVGNNLPVAAVITQPDRPKGRGQVLTPPPVKVVAERHRLNVLQPEKIKDRVFLDRLADISPDLIVVAAFGQILPPEVLECAPMGCINVHPSLLPKYRGAAPMNWTLIQGETKTGVTIMFMDEGLDTGDILTQEETAIAPGETFGMLHNRLSQLGAELLLNTITTMQEGSVKRISQDDALATYAPKLKKEDTCIRWDADVYDIVNLIRGLSPVPCAYTVYEGKKMKLFTADGEVAAVAGIAGQAGAETEKGLPVAAKNGTVYLKDVQLEGKKKMSIHDLLRGFRILPGDMLG